MVAKFFIRLALHCAPLAAMAAEPVLPTGYPAERYERIWKKSPFTVASVIAPEVVDTSTFADSLTLVGLLTIDGKPLVTVVSNDSQETQLIEADKPNAAGLQVSSFINNLDPSKVEVVLKKGESTGTLRFSINETAAPPQPVVVNDAPQQPRRLIQPGNNLQPPTQPRVIPRVGAPVMPPQNSAIIRRRTLQLPGANRPNPNGGAAIPPPK